MSIEKNTTTAFMLTGDVPPVTPEPVLAQSVAPLKSEGSGAQLEVTNGSGAYSNGKQTLMVFENGDVLLFREHDGPFQFTDPAIAQRLRQQLEEIAPDGITPVERACMDYSISDVMDDHKLNRSVKDVPIPAGYKL